ncbi:MAG: DEAD/DEAH box helicase [Candidatus Marsarchaeota archaeon]|nr:DEAD/DEAH box helicase [Candidatus Marsarchaeota archaeon]
MLEYIIEKLNVAPNTMQKSFFEGNFHEKPRVVVSSPTASGKTLLAEVAMIKNFLEEKKKSVYIVPLKALAEEKFKSFSEKLALFGMTVGISTGDYDSSPFTVQAYDVLIVTSEKMDSLLRHGIQTKTIGLIVVDEVHLIDDEERGSALEMVVTKLKRSGCKILALSATIPNGVEIASWIDGELFESDYSVKNILKTIGVEGEAVFHDGVIRYDDVEDLVANILRLNPKNQILVFVSSRKNAESVAQKLNINAFLTEQDKLECLELSEKSLKTLPTPTSQCRKISESLKKGVAFHHAGLERKKLKLIEQGFKEKRCLRVIACTTTLAMGIDYPASWVIVKEIRRFNGMGSSFIPSLEVSQMSGRAGRPQYDKEGRVVIMCSEKDKNIVESKYLSGKLENIFSKLSSEKALRTHVLSLIASGDAKSLYELNDFFENTFYAVNYGDIEGIKRKIENVVNLLQLWGFVTENFKATKLGKRASELYLDPLTARKFLDFDGGGLFDYIILIVNSGLMPLLYSKKGESLEEAWSFFPEDVYSVEKYKTSRALNAWINEYSEKLLLEEFDFAPGNVFSSTRIAEWLFYCLAELSFIQNKTGMVRQARRLAVRMKYGVKEELIDLCSIRGVGRVRARRLWNKGIKSVEQYEKMKNEAKINF